MGRIVRIITILLACTSVFYFCSGDKLTNTGCSTAIVPQVVWKKGNVTTTPDEVDSVKITISYDSTFVVKTFPFSADTGTFESLPSSAIIQVMIEGLDSNSIVVYRGVKDSILLVGDWVEVIIEAHEVTPIAPANLQAVLDTNNIILTWWDKSTNETLFYIERKTGSDSLALFDSLAFAAESDSTFIDSVLTPLTTYTYRIYAQNSAGLSLHYSESLPLMTPDTVTCIK